jgi:hypothetical protein
MFCAEGGHLQACKRAKALFTEGFLGLQAYRQAYKRATKRTGRGKDVGVENVLPGEETAWGVTVLKNLSRSRNRQTL